MYEKARGYNRVRKGWGSLGSLGCLEPTLHMVVWWERRNDSGESLLGRRGWRSLSIAGRPFLNCTSPPQECVVSLPHHTSAYQNFPRKRVWEWEFGKCHEWFRYCEHEGKPWQRRGYGLRIKGFISWAMEKEGFGKWGNDRIESLFKRCRVRIRVEKM